MYEEPFAVWQDAAADEPPLYPWVEGLVPRPEMREHVTRKMIRTEARFAAHELTVQGKSTRILDHPVIRGRWPTGQSSLVLNEAFPLLAPWTCYILADAFGGMMDDGEEVVVYGTAVPTYRAALTTPLSDGDLYQKFHRYLRDLRATPDESGWFEIADEALARRVVARYAGSLISLHPAELYDVQYSGCGDPRCTPVETDTEKATCPHCGSPAAHALLTQPENTLVCIGRMHMRAHDSNDPKNGGVVSNGTRVSVWYAPCGEVLEQGAATRIRHTPENAGGAQSVSVDGQEYKLVGRKGYGSKSGQYSYRRHIQRKVGQAWPLTPTTKSFEDFICERLRLAGALSFGAGNAQAAESYFYQLVYWTGKTCRVPLWRTISARIGLSIPDICATAARQLCGAAPADLSLCEGPANDQTLSSMVQATLIAALRAKLRDRASQTAPQIEDVERGVARYTGEARADRVILQTLAQFVSASLGVKLRNIGRSTLYSDTDERAIAAKRAVLEKLNWAARELGWPECEFRDDRVETGILFRKRDDTPSPAVDTLECTRALFHKHDEPAAEASEASPAATPDSTAAPPRPAAIDFSQVVRIKRSRHAAAPPSPPAAEGPCAKRPCPG